MGFLKTRITTKAQKITEFTVDCDYSVVPCLYGTNRIVPNCINYLDFTTKEKRTTTKSGKSKSTQVDYQYFAYLELALGEPIDGIGRVWTNDDVYDSLPTFNAKGDAREGAPLSLNIGNNPDPTVYMTTNHNDIAVGYPSLAYLYGKVYLGTNTASVPNYSIEVLGKLRNLMSDGVDANPAYIIRDILTQLGLGEYIDEASFNRYATYCQEYGMLVSTPSETSQKKAQEFVAELLDLTQTYLFWSVDKFKFVPQDDREWGNYQPDTNIVMDLDFDDINLKNNKIVSFKHKDNSEQYNYITVSYTNRENEYEEESVSFKTGDGEIKKLEVDGSWIHTKERAVKYAQSLARQLKAESNSYTFELDWVYSMLEVGDLIRVSDSSIGLERQVVVISDINENEDGRFTVTALPRLDSEVYGEAIYEVSNNYNKVNLNVEPSNTKAPIFITPPSDLVTSATGVELWVALQGTDDTWGGCMVYVAGSDKTFVYHGTQDINTTYGKTTTSLDDSVTIRLSNHNIIELTQGSELACESGNTKLWINGEIISYKRSEYLGDNTYRLSDLVRGQHNTEATSHSAGEDVVILDGSLYTLYLTKEQLESTIYLRFPAFNMLHKNAQELVDCEEYATLVSPYDLPNVGEVTATSRYTDTNGFYPRYDIILQWENPSFSTFAGCEVMYKTNSLGYSGDDENTTVVSGWQSAGFTTASTLTIPQCGAGDNYTIAVCVRDTHGFQELPDQSAKIDVVVTSKTAVPTAPTNLSMSYGTYPTLKWDFVTNADVKYYEVWSEGGTLLARTNTNSASLPTSIGRSGTVYLRAISVFDQPSTDASLTYSKTAPAKPTKPNVYPNLDTILIKTSAIPTSAIGIMLYINGEAFDLGTSTSYSYNSGAGSYIVQYAYYDCFGEGTMSNETGVFVEASIPNEYFEGIKITAENLDSSLKETIDSIEAQADINTEIQQAIAKNANDIIANRGSITNLGTQISSTNDSITSLATRVDGNSSKITRVEQTANGLTSRVATAESNITQAQTNITQTSNSINTVVSNLKNNRVSEYTAFTQLENAIGLRAMKTDIKTGQDLIAEINAGVTRDDEGNVTSTIKLDAGLINITGDTVFNEDVIIRGTMESGSISIAGSDVVLDANGLGFYSQGPNRIRYGGIGRMVLGMAEDGKRVEFSHPWDSPPIVLIMPQKFQTTYTGYTTSILETICQASNITKNGFTVECYQTLKSGSNGSLNGMDMDELSFDPSETYAWQTTEQSQDLSIPATATHISVPIICTYEAPHWWRTHSNVDEDWTIDYYGSKGYAVIVVELLAGSTVIATYTSSQVGADDTKNTSKNNNWGGNFSTTLDAKFTAGQPISLRVTLRAYRTNGIKNPIFYNTTTYPAKCNVTINSVSFDVSDTSQRVSSGMVASFIAVENVNGGFVVKDA